VYFPTAVSGGIRSTNPRKGARECFLSSQMSALVMDPLYSILYFSICSTFWTTRRSTTGSRTTRLSTPGNQILSLSGVCLFIFLSQPTKSHDLYEDPRYRFIDQKLNKFLDPVPFLKPFDPGSGFGMNIADPVSKKLRNIFLGYNTSILGCGGIFLTLDPGWKKFKSEIGNKQFKHPYPQHGKKASVSKPKNLNLHERKACSSRERCHPSSLNHELYFLLSGRFCLLLSHFY
jgi:hypothetical protein